MNRRLSDVLRSALFFGGEVRATSNFCSPARRPVRRRGARRRGRRQSLSGHTWKFVQRRFERLVARRRRHHAHRRGHGHSNRLQAQARSALRLLLLPTLQYLRPRRPDSDEAQPEPQPRWLAVGDKQDCRGRLVRGRLRRGQCASVGAVVGDTGHALHHDDLDRERCRRSRR